LERCDVSAGDRRDSSSLEAAADGMLQARAGREGLLHPNLEVPLREDQ